MPRVGRQAPGGMVFHVLNRGVGRLRLFDKDEDYSAFERVLEQTLAVRPMRVCAYCVMPTHWHLLLWPRQDGELAAFMHRLTITHVRRWVEHRHEVGMGHVYQGRYKSFPVQHEGHFLTVARYVERNPLRVAAANKLVDRAEDWRWSSLWRRAFGNADEKQMLSGWPVDRPRNWVWRVNRPESVQELEMLRLSVNRGRPYGSDRWMSAKVKALGLESTVRPRGRPRIKE